MELLRSQAVTVNETDKCVVRSVQYQSCIL